MSGALETYVRKVRESDWLHGNQLAYRDLLLAWYDELLASQERGNVSENPVLRRMEDEIQKVWMSLSLDEQAPFNTIEVE